MAAIRNYYIDTAWLREHEGKELVAMNEPVSIVCSTCGYTRVLRLGASHSMNPCPQCRQQERLDKKFGTGQIKIIEYSGTNHEKSRLLSTIDNREFSRAITNLLSNQKKTARISHKKNIEEIREIAETRGFLLGHNEDTILVANKINLICPKHGPFSIRLGHFLYDKDIVGCPACRNELRSRQHTKSLETAQREINQRHGFIERDGKLVPFYEIDKNSYRGTSYRCTITCNACNGSMFVWPFAIARGIMSCSCQKKINSRGELFLQEELSSLGLKYETEVKFTDCKDKSLLPFDFRIWTQGTWFLVEFDGIQHFSQAWYDKDGSFFRSTQYHDRIKNDYCEERGIFLIRIQSKNSGRFTTRSIGRTRLALAKAGAIMAFFSKLTRKHPWVISIEI